MEAPKIMFVLLGAIVLMSAIQAIEVAALVSTLQSGSFATQGASLASALPTQVGGCG